MTIDLAMAGAYIEALTGSLDTPCTWQTFDDSPAKRSGLARICHGPLQRHAEVLSYLNEQGAGIFVTVNETDLRGRSAENVTAIRALFVDWDDGGDVRPLPVGAPSIVVKSARGHHGYWLLEPGAPVSEFRGAQERLIAYLGSDPVIKDLPRVMRVPGFFHRKGQPVLVQLVEAHPERRWSFDSVSAGLPDATRNVAPPAPTGWRPPPDTSNALDRARAWMSKRDPSIEGCGGDVHLFATAAALVNDFLLDQGDALELLREWNLSCVPPWDDRDLKAKIKSASRSSKKPAGNKLDEHTVPHDPYPGVDIGPLLEGLNARTVERQKSTLRDLLVCPGLVGELADWINECSHRPQPILALAASIAAVSAIVGRKIMLPGGLRSNLYVLGVGETGCGKDAARQAIKRLFVDIGAEAMLGESFASGSAVEQALTVSPSSLYLIDEVGHFLGSVKDAQAPSYIKQIIPMFLRMYNSSEGIYIKSTYASAERNAEGGSRTIDHPSLTFYATTVPSNLFTGITREQLRDGLISRLLVFESEDPLPTFRSVSSRAKKVPPSLALGFRRWFEASINPNAQGAALASDPPEATVTPEAACVWHDLATRSDARCHAVREAGGEQGPYTRTLTTAMKLSLIRACGISQESPTVTADDARWGANLAELLTDSFIDKFGDNVVESKSEDMTMRVYKIISKCKGNGIERSVLLRSSHLSSKELNDAITTLVESNRVSVKLQKPLPTLYVSSHR